MGSSCGGQVRELSVVRLHNNAIVVRGILLTVLNCGKPEPRLRAIYIVSSVGTSLQKMAVRHLTKSRCNTHTYP